MKKILITGSCGFVMGNFIRKAIYERAPYNFVSIDRVNSNTINSMYWNKNHIFHVADIRDQHIIDIIFQFEKPDIVIHGASEFIDSASTNVVGTQNIINACLKHKVQRLIYLSVDGVYKASESLIEETDAIDPKTPYTATKAAGELLIKAIHPKSELKYNIIRGSNTYGPRQFSDQLIPAAIRSILKSIPMQLESMLVQDWTHVFDYCSAILTILEKGNDNEIYNVSAHQEFSNIEIIQKICVALNKPEALEYFTNVQDEFSINCNIKLNTDKIKTIGWKPFYKLKDGIIGTTEWYTNNQWFLK